MGQVVVVSNYTVTQVLKATPVERSNEVDQLVEGSRPDGFQQVDLGHIHGAIAGTSLNCPGINDKYINLTKSILPGPFEEPSNSFL